MKYFSTLFSLCCFIVFTSKAFTQNFKDRISLGIESGFNVRDEGPSALFIGIEPKVQVNEFVTVGMRYEKGVSSFGEEKNFFGNYSGTYYTEVEPIQKQMSSFGVNGYFHFSLLRSKVFVGVGASYFRKSPVKYSKVYFDGNETSFDHSPEKSKIGPSISLGYIDGERIYFVLTKNYSQKDVDDYDHKNRMYEYISMRLGYRLIRDEMIFDRSIQDNILPILMIEAGYHVQTPLNGDFAGAIRSYIETKIAIWKSFSIGIQLPSSLSAKLGVDSDQDDRHFIKQYVGAKELGFAAANRMASTSSTLITADYYYQYRRGWFSLGCGVGKYTRDSSNEVINYKIKPPKLLVPEIPGEENFGFMVGADYKTNLFRVGMDVHFTGKDIPDYLSFHFGIEPGFGRKWRKRKVG